MCIIRFSNNKSHTNNKHAKQKNREIIRCTIVWNPCRWFNKQDFCIGCTCVFFLIRKHQLDYWEVHMQNQNGHLPISAHFQTPTGVFQPFFKRITKIMKAQLQTKPPVDKSKSAKAMEMANMVWHTPLTETHLLVFCRDTCMILCSSTTNHC